MLGMIGAVVFFSAAVFSLVVITQMVRGYLPLIEAALRDEPMPRTDAPRARAYGMRARHRHNASTFTPRRLEGVRAAA